MGACMSSAAGGATGGATDATIGFWGTGGIAFDGGGGGDGGGDGDGGCCSGGD